ncbi:uncharacterized protein LAESUDRAFT_761248 [Laetiporus sulphureus 93-53]|uniref:Endonuclease/exonuclease/phosphatase domain-containing protein n=1 Tax=Laetiporus sulphureus 93-53 TaxID=1314785 RepID=A0A165D436_9APHY|nr:uncharacterized protein LAESUDRAFT_761248 [Laetiporus sulphureus 93-53]KZT04116.1 hypothetical protein LAESUDRAFT_761248 [Laetiporus sulphureus 93-53]
MSAISAQQVTASESNMEGIGVERTPPGGSPPPASATTSASAPTNTHPPVHDNMRDTIRSLRNNLNNLAVGVQRVIEGPYVAVAYSDEFENCAVALSTCIRDFHNALVNDPLIVDTEAGAQILPLYQGLFHQQLASAAVLLDDDTLMDEVLRTRPRTEGALPVGIDVQAALTKAVEDGVRMATSAINTWLSAIEAQLVRGRPLPHPPQAPEGPRPQPPVCTGCQRAPAATSGAAAPAAQPTTQPEAQALNTPTMAQVAAKNCEKCYVLLITSEQHAAIEAGGTMPQWYAKVHTHLRETPTWAKVRFLGLRFAGPTKVQAAFSHDSPDALIKECLRPIHHLLGVVPRALSPALGPREQASVPQDFRPLAPVTKLFLPSCPLRHPDSGDMLTEEEILAELRRNSMFSSIHFNGLPGFVVPPEHREQLGKSSLIISIEDVHCDFCAHNLLGRDNRSDAAGFVWFYGSRLMVKKSKDRPVFQPWWGQIGIDTPHGSESGATVFGHVNVWPYGLDAYHFPSTSALPRPRASILVRRVLLNTYHISMRTDLVSDPDVVVLHFVSRSDPTHDFFVVNCYNEGSRAQHRVLPTLYDIPFPPRANLLVTGDFNLHHPLWSWTGRASRSASTASTAFAGWLERESLEILNDLDQPTHMVNGDLLSGTIIDLLWWNDACDTARANVQAAPTREERREAKATLSATIRQARKDWTREAVARLQHTDPWWLASWTKGVRAPPLPVIRADGVTGSLPADAGRLVTRFYFPASPPLPNLPPLFTSAPPAAHPDRPLLITEVTAAIEATSNYSAPGISGVSWRLLKWVWRSGARHALFLFLSSSLRLGYLPAPLRAAAVVYLPKPGKADYTAPKSH